MNDRPRPFLKWAGGKTRLLPRLVRRLPSGFGHYHEPFLGGGALFFRLAGGSRPPRRAYLSDLNDDLVTAYRGVRDCLDAVVERLREHARLHGREHYYQVRDRGPGSGDLPERAARFIYLNRTCYNGLYRVSRRGRFNVPMGRYTRPRICDPGLLAAASRALAAADLRPAPFESVLERAGPGDLVYMDPPYQPLSATASFTAYHRNGFSEQDQRRLREVFGALVERGAHVVLSNSDSPLIRELYRDYPMEAAPVARSINSRSSGRGAVTELIVLGGSIAGQVGTGP